MGEFTKDVGIEEIVYTDPHGEVAATVPHHGALEALIDEALLRTGHSVWCPQEARYVAGTLDQLDDSRD